MTKQGTIEFLQKDHKKMEDVLAKLSMKKKTEVPIIEKWTVRDILAHIAAWKIEQVHDIDVILRGKKPWYVDSSDDDYNKQAVEKRKSWSYDKVYHQWQESFKNLISRIEALSSEEWNARTKHRWKSGRRITIQTLFSDYTFEEDGHEGIHAEDIRKALHIK